MNLEERVEQLEFQVQLLFDDSAISRYLFETKITKTQYHKIMDFMDTMRKKIDNDEEIHYCSFEQGIYDIVPERKGDYHFCENSLQKRGVGRKYFLHYMEVWLSMAEEQTLILESNF